MSRKKAGMQDAWRGLIQATESGDSACDGQCCLPPYRQPCPRPQPAGPASDAVKFFYVPAVKFEADAQYRDRFTEPVTKLFDLNDQATKKNPDQVACIDFDPGLDAQDFDQKTVSKTLKLSETVDGDTAQVVANFKLFRTETMRSVKCTGR